MNTKEVVLQAIYDVTKVGEDRIKSPDRHASVVIARHVFINEMARLNPELRLSEIGEMINRHYSTISIIRSKYYADMDTYPAFIETVKRVQQRITDLIESKVYIERQDTLFAYNGNNSHGEPFIAVWGDVSQIPTDIQPFCREIKARITIQEL